MASLNESIKIFISRATSLARLITNHFHWRYCIGGCITLDVALYIFRWRRCDKQSWACLLSCRCCHRTAAFYYNFPQYKTVTYTLNEWMPLLLNIMFRSANYCESLFNWKHVCINQPKHRNVQVLNLSYWEVDLKCIDQRHLHHRHRRMSRVASMGKQDHVERMADSKKV